LGEEKGLGRSAETPGLGDFIENFELMQVHGKNGYKFSL
jgi:Na+-translocating ferredoxin:NAD+ oxidoreductase RnfG subunit